MEINMVRFKPIKHHSLNKLRTISRKNLTWPQAYRLNPKLKAFVDSDGDGLWNTFDCHPFDRKRHNNINFKFGNDGRIVVPKKVQDDIDNPKVPFKDLSEKEKDWILYLSRMKKKRKREMEEDAYYNRLDKLQGDIHD